MKNNTTMNKQPKKEFTGICPRGIEGYTGKIRKYTGEQFGRNCHMVEAHENGDFYCYNEERELHCEGAPALEWADGRKEWHKNGKLHREDGAAMTLPDGSKRWYLNDVKMTKEEFDEKISMQGKPRPEINSVYANRNPQQRHPIGGNLNPQNNPIERSSRKTIVADLYEYCYLTPADKGHYVEVTRWLNSQGVDIVVDDGDGQKMISLTYGQLNAIRACVHEMRDGTY